MFHIVFQSADIDVLQKAMALDSSLQGDIIEIKDELAVGPIADIYETEGYQQRRDWWKEVLEFSPYTEALNIADDKLTVHNLLRKLDEDSIEVVWIWMAQNTHDVCGYYWLMPQLKAYQGRVFVLYLNNLPFINDKGGLFYPVNLFEILPKEIIKAKRLARTITLSEFEIDPDEWKKLCAENAIVRVLEGGKKITGREASYYDKDILQAATGEPQKLSKIFATLFGKMKLHTGDVFLAWRIRRLAAEGKLEITGDWGKGWKEIGVKLAGTTA
jgi:hypothetical protein